MSLTWPAKDPNETLDYSVDWSRFLGSNTISSVSWAIEDSAGDRITITPPQTVEGLTVNGYSNTGTVATIQLSAGTLHRMYKIVCSITYDGLVATRTLHLSIRTK
jgi:hypothetical protein